MDKDALDVIYKQLQARYECYSYGHALEVLRAFPEEWGDILAALAELHLTVDDITKAGGNESPIPKKFDDILYPRGWREIRISGDLTVKKYPRQAAQRRGRFADEPYETETIEGYIDGHNIDFLKNRVAFDLEWNSKDQTFDRDLLAMRTYHECGLVDVGVIVTRAQNLNDIFKPLGIMAKYGASTTWLGKLTYRLESRRNGGCPILAVGIKKQNVEGWQEIDTTQRRLSAYDRKLTGDGRDDEV